MFSDDLPQNAWKRSRRCDNSGPNCVEVLTTGTEVHVRNSTNPAATLTFTNDEWRTFTDGVRDGEFAI